MADEATIREAFRIQHRYCTVMGAPITARLCDALADGLIRNSQTGIRVLDWPGDPTADALPLRLVGGLHSLHLADMDPDLPRVFGPKALHPLALQAVVAALLRRYDARLLPWLDGPPQTNEPGRAGPLMLGLVAVARAFGLPIDLLEIGSSAGLNLMIDRFAIDLGGRVLGPASAPVQLRPEWRGAQAPDGPDPQFLRIRGVDIQPIDLKRDEAAERLRAYVWADDADRLARLTQAIALQRAHPVDLAAGDAADWLAKQMAEPQPSGTVRVLMHSVVWQYLGAERQSRITAMMDAAGTHATPDRPLAWIRMEPDRAQDPRMELWLRHWPDPQGQGWTRLADTQAHGRWIAPVAG